LDWILGAETPEEIAISIAAEIVAVKKGKFAQTKKVNEERKNVTS